MNYQNEFQAAFEVSKINEAMRENTPEEIEDRQKINSALDSGKFVVVEEMIKYCRFTDASMGIDVAYHSEYDSFSAADAFLTAEAAKDEYPCNDGWSILTPAGYVEPVDADYEEYLNNVPF